MLIIKVKNGLGNQLFSYALGLYLLRKNPAQIVKYDFSDVPYYIGGRYTVKFSDFVCGINELEPCEIRKYLGKKWFYGRFKSDTSLAYKISIRLNSFAKVQRDCVLIKEPVEYWTINDEFVKKINNINILDSATYFFDGVWENIEYLLPVRNELINTINLEGGKVDCKLIEVLNKNNTVSVHIRRGDYVCESFQTDYPRNFYMICDKSYYNRAFNTIRNSIEDPLFVFFSDDPDFIEDEFENISNKIIIKGNRDYEDLYLMKLCRHHILANSTFSFWGAFLASKVGINIAPKTHYYRLLSPEETMRREFFRVPEWIYLDGNEIK